MALLSPTQVSQKAMISFFFHDTTEDGLPPIWKCKKCLQYKKKSGGWTNLLNHLKACVGPKYQEEYVQVVKDNVFAAFKPTVSKREADMFGWIEWVVMRNMPLAEVDDEITRTGMRNGPITSKLLRKMLFCFQLKSIVKSRRNCLIKLSLYLMDGLRGLITTLLFMPLTLIPFQMLLWRHCFPFNPFFVMEYWE